MNRAFLLLSLAVLYAAPVWGGGAWLPAQGEGNVQWGFSRKTADTWWDADGHKGIIRRNDAGETHYHDFRYGYLAGEVGLRPRLAATFVFTYLWGFEGYQPDLEKNFGFSDAWLGLKYQLRDGDWPLAARLVWRTPFLYDQQGPYERHLYDDEGVFIMNNAEWRGLLRNDLALGFALSHSLRRFPGWISLEGAYNFRQGAPADEVPVAFELGYTPQLNIPHPLHLKLAFNLVASVGNDSAKEPIDRFRTGHAFNSASMLRGALSLRYPLDHWGFEVGYAQWLWGRGARVYREPFATLSYGF